MCRLRKDLTTVQSIVSLVKSREQAKKEYIRNLSTCYQRQMTGKLPSSYPLQHDYLELDLNQFRDLANNSKRTRPKTKLKTKQPKKDRLQNHNNDESVNQSSSENEEDSYKDEKSEEEEEEEEDDEESSSSSSSSSENSDSFQRVRRKRRKIQNNHSSSSSSPPSSPSSSSSLSTDHYH